MDGDSPTLAGDCPRELIGTLTERHRRERRGRELGKCGSYFKRLRDSEVPSEERRFSMDAAIYADLLQGLPLTPREALRLPRLAPQPKAWVVELWEAMDDGR